MSGPESILSALEYSPGERRDVHDRFAVEKRINHETHAAGQLLIQRACCVLYSSGLLARDFSSVSES